MAWQPPQEMPEDLDALDAALWDVYRQGEAEGRRKEHRDLVEKIKNYLNQEFFHTKQNRRRADPTDPKVQAIRAIMERLYNKFEDGSL